MAEYIDKVFSLSSAVSREGELVVTRAVSEKDEVSSVFHSNSIALDILGFNLCL